MRVLTGLCLLAALSVCLTSGRSGGAELPADFAWVEAEAPLWKNFEFQVDTRRAALLSGGKWLLAAPARNAIPADGCQANYSFTLAAEGKYELWARVGFESARAPMDWRVDDREWATLPPEQQTSSLMEIATSNEVAWAKCGVQDLTAGKHTLELRWPAGNRDKLFIALDCLAFVRGEGRFVPEGRLRPGETYNEPADQRAAAQVYALAEDAGANGARVELPLSGPWQAARYDDAHMEADTYQPVGALPEPQVYPLRWLGLEVPCDAWQARPELVFAHRLFFQTRVSVPEKARGRSFLLHFGGTSWIASVFVNGQWVGSRQSVLVPWDLDITKAVHPGQANVLTIGIKGGYYGFDVQATKGKAPSLNLKRNTPRLEQFLKLNSFVDALWPSTKGEGDGLALGLVNPVKLIVAGPAYTADVFVRTSVARKRLEADIELKNTTGAALDVQVQCEAVQDKTGQVEKTFLPLTASLPAGETQTLKLAADWAGAKLWWPSESVTDLPDCYLLRTTILANGRPADVRQDLFGFRELTLEGRSFLLNGVHWHFYNWSEVPDARTPDEWFAKYHAEHDRFHFLSADCSRRFGPREQAVEWLDRHGVPSRCGTCMDGMFSTYSLTNPLVWKNFDNHVRQVVRAYRNHPGILHWQVGSELLLTGARLSLPLQYEKCETETNKLLLAAKELDPTRPAYEDGAGDLGGLAPVNSQHCAWAWSRDVPRGLNQYPTGPVTRPRPVAKPELLYRWDGARPLMDGEEFNYAASGSLAWIGGPQVYAGKAERDAAGGRYARMGLEGARWQDVAGCSLRSALLPGAKEGLAPRAVFVREYNRCFYPERTLRRNYVVFNEGRQRQVLTVKWRLSLGGKEAAAGEKEYTVEPGQRQMDTLSATTPAAAGRVDGQLSLELYAQGAKVYEDAEPISVLPLLQNPPGLNAQNLCVLDPEGSVSKWLDDHQQPYASLKENAAIPATASVLLIGGNALTLASGKVLAPRLRDFVRRGHTALILEQHLPFQGADLRFDGLVTAGAEKGKPATAEFLRLGGQSGSICHPVAAAHRVLRDLQAGDFFTWAGAETNYRMSYAAPPTGAAPLVLAGDDLFCAPLLEIPYGPGSYLLCQLLVAEKLSVEPVADRLLQNMLGWAAERAAAKPAKTLLCDGPDHELEGYFGTLGVEFKRVGVPADAFGADVQVVVLRATAAHLKWLQDNAAAVRAWCGKGGWLMLLGLESDGLAAFDALAGVPHRLRPFAAEAVGLEARADALLLGLSDLEFTQYGTEVVAPSTDPRRPSDKVFSNVLETPAESTTSARRAVPLTRPAGLVKYPLGPGGIVLNQLRYAVPDEALNVARKKAIFVNLLRNLGVTLKMEPPEIPVKPPPKK